MCQGQMIMQDRLEKERGDAKNAVEEYVYDMRDKLCNQYSAFVKEDVSILGHQLSKYNVVYTNSICIIKRTQNMVYF